MSEEIVCELTFWVIYLLAGVVITFAYDFLRIVRKVLPHKGFMVAWEDFLFWIATTIVLFVLLYRLNDGIIRWFAIFGLMLGMLIYKKIFSELYVNHMSAFIRRTLYLVWNLLSTPLNLVKRRFLSMFQWQKCLILKGKKRLTGDIKEVNITLCKHFSKKNRRNNKGKTHEP